MSMDPKRIIAPLQAHYDKIIAVIAMAGLVFTLLVLGVRATAAKREQVKFDGWLSELRPTTPPVAHLDKKVFTDGYVELESPPQFPPSEGAEFYVPEVRYTCDILVCAKPIPISSTNCPFCGAVQITNKVVVVKLDGDNDNIPDKWERAHGMNPELADDAEDDLDGDGFTCWEEYHAGDEGMYGRRTHPTKKEDMPPPYAYEKLCVIETKALEFWLKFMSANKTGAKHEDGTDEYKFQFNHSLSKYTFWRKLGEPVLGFTPIKYEEKFEKNPATGGNLDVSVLSLRAADGAMISLKAGETKTGWQKATTLRYLPGRKSFEELKKGAEFSINNQKFVVKEIDADSNTVLVIDTSRNNKVVKIVPRPE